LFFFISFTVRLALALRIKLRLGKRGRFVTFAGPQLPSPSYLARLTLSFPGLGTVLSVLLAAFFPSSTISRTCHKYNPHPAPSGRPNMTPVCVPFSAGHARSLRRYSQFFLFYLSVQCAFLENRHSSDDLLFIGRFFTPPSIGFLFSFRIFNYLIFSPFLFGDFVEAVYTNPYF